MTIAPVEIPDPHRYNTFPEWADEFVYLNDRFGITGVAGPSWFEFAGVLAQEPVFSTFNVPDPRYFDTWRGWVSALARSSGSRLI